LASLPRARPDAVTVLSYTDGRAVAFSGRPSLTQRWGVCHVVVVDTSDHRTRQPLQLPAQGDVYFFQGELDVVWRVVDAAGIVRRNITDGTTLVVEYLADIFWRVTRRHAPDDVANAEDDARTAASTPFTLGEGIEIVRYSLRLKIDQRMHERVTNLDDVGHVRAIRRVEGAMTGDRVGELKELWDQGEALIFLHLAKNPGDTASIMEMIARSRERDDQSRLGLLDRLLEKGFIQDADVGPLREHILGATPAIAAPFGAPDPQPPVPVPDSAPPAGGAVYDPLAAPPPGPAPDNVVRWKRVGGAHGDSDEE
jgi:hypothetical protein